MSDPVATTKPVLSWVGARVAADAAIDKAIELGINIVVMVMDKGGDQLVTIRMEGASPLHGRSAYGKALCGVSLKQSTGQFLERAKNDDDLYAAVNAAGDMFLVPGGFPLVYDDEVVGSIGVSGAKYVQDTLCAEAGVAAFEARAS